MTIIKDGGGSGKFAKVDSSNKLETHSIQISEIQEAGINGDSYNINTGLISITGSTDSGLLYFRNLEDRDFVIDSIALGVTAGTAADIGIMTLVKNPISGDVISGTNPVDMNQSRNFGSSQTLANSLAYKGTDGDTLTGGTDVGIFTQSLSGRLFATVDFVLPKGTSIGIKFNPNLSSGSVNVYAALIGHLRRTD